MGELSLDERLQTMIQEVDRVSPADSSLGVGRSGSGDGLDRLADAIDGLLKRFQDRTEAARIAQQALLKLQVPGAPSRGEPSQEQLLLLSTLEEDAPDSIYFKDTQGRFVHLSKARVKAFDLVSTDEIVGMTDFDFFTEEHARAAWEDEQKVMRTGEPIVAREEKETWLDRPPTWVVTTRMPLRDRHGAIIGTCGISRNITERKRAEERYRLLFNSINDAVCVNELTPDGMPGPITEVNDIACDSLGYTREELLGTDALAFLAPYGPTALTEVMARLRAYGEAVWESTSASKAGARIPVEINSHLLDVSGGLTMLSTIRDISGRKQLEENLAREKALLATLIDNLPDYVSIKDTESRILITNPANARTMGIGDPVNVVGKTDLDFYPAEEARRYRADEEGVLRTGQPLINKEEESKAPDGGPRWTLTTKVPLRDAQGTIIGTVCTGRDITGLKLAELALRREAVRRRVLFEEASDGIVVLDNALNVVEANASFAGMLGYSREEVLSLRPWNWDATRPTEPQFRAAWPGAPTERITIETRHRRKDGSVFDAEISVNPAVFSGEYQVYCACRDITERKQAEERIHDLARFTDESPYPVIRVTPRGSILYANQSARLLLPSWEWMTDAMLPAPHTAELGAAWAANEPRKIETRDGSTTVELTIMPIPSRGYINIYGRDVTEEKSLSEKFLQAQKMEAIGRFAGGIAHDFNNLLTVIGGYCDLAREDLPEGGPVKQKIDEISRAARQAAALTARLLAFSRKQVMVPRVLELNGLVTAEENILARLLGEDIQLVTSLRSEAGNIRADPGQVEQVLMNLAVNSRDAMPHGGRLTIETANVELNEADARSHPELRLGAFVMLAVRDTGCGMDSSTRARVFEPFFTTKDVGKGTGLGLATVYGIVQQSGGHINLESEPGLGTTFRIYFPRVEEVVTPQPAHAPRTAASAGQETVLVVEDEPGVRTLVCEVLRRHGYTVLAAANGDEAVTRCTQHPGRIDLLVTDVVMPVMSGRQLADRLVEQNAAMKVLYMSGYVNPEGDHATPWNGRRAFLQKPFKPDALARQVRLVLDQ
jgi:two-component system, cell cycle sensor histidine kinase and response regulator CckA